MTTGQSEERIPERCGTCGLVQYVLPSGLCRRCKNPMSLLRHLDNVYPGWRQGSIRLTSLSASVANPVVRDVTFARTLGKRIKMIRKAKGLKDKDLEGVITRSGLYRLENGECAPTISLMEKLAVVFKMTMAEMLSQTNKEAVIADDSFVCDMAALIKVIPWSKWPSIIQAMKRLSLGGLGVDNAMILQVLANQLNSKTTKNVYLPLPAKNSGARVNA